MGKRKSGRSGQIGGSGGGKRFSGLRKGKDAMFKCLRRIICILIVGGIAAGYFAFTSGGAKFRWFGKKTEETGKAIHQTMDKTAEKADEVKKTTDESVKKMDKLSKDIKKKIP